jgi:hypothetical protein
MGMFGRLETARRAAVRRAGTAILAGLMTATHVDAQEAASPVREPITVHVVPPDLAEVGWMDEMAEAQRSALAGSTLRHQFVDRREASGIDFRHRIVDDAGKTYKPAHYDHGNGVAIADVDGDGHTDIYFTTQVGANQLWRNRGDGTFENRTDTAVIGLVDAVSVSASFADIDNDGDPDLFVTTVRGGNHLFENDGTGRFRDITVRAGLQYSGHSSTGLFLDVDRDGRIDLFVVNVGRFTSDQRSQGTPDHYEALADAFSGHLHPDRAERSLLYRNVGGRFVDVTDAMGLGDLSWSGDATPIDGNDDGLPDLYLPNMLGDDEYYENEGGKRFVKRSRAVFPRTPWGAMGVKTFDANGDGRLDLLVTDMHSDMSGPVLPAAENRKSDMKWPESFRGTGASSIWGNALFLKDGPGRYREVSDAWNAESYCPWGPSVADLNADGYEDVFIASGMNFPDRYMRNVFKLNDGGRRFVDAEFVVGIEPRAGGVATPWFEIDAFGADRDHPGAAGARTRRVAFVAAKGSRSSAVFDIDSDGDLDIVTNEFNAPPLVLVSDLAQRHTVHSLTVRLIGTRSNRDGLGAVVTVVSGGRRQVRVHDGQSGYLSHSVAPLYFGLADQAKVDRVEVAWPSGRTQVVAAPASGSRVLVIREPR